MSQYTTSRAMVSDQLVTRGIRDKRVLNAMAVVPRQKFVRPSDVDIAFEDHPIPIGYGQTISQPYMVATMTEQLELRGAEKVLEIGTGSGYQAAILSLLSKEVYTVERIPELLQAADARFKELGYNNIHTKAGDGTLGWPEEAPFDRILVTAGAPKVPQPLFDQLAEDGMLLLPVGGHYTQQLILCTKVEGKMVCKEGILCVFVKLIGREGW